MTEYPKRNIGYTAEGWAIDLETNEYIKTERKNDELFTDEQGWLYITTRQKSDPIED